jgi:hypothetical protein
MTDSPEAVIVERTLNALIVRVWKLALKNWWERKKNDDYEHARKNLA